MNHKKWDFAISGSVCTRCGRPRVAIDSYEERVEKSVLTYTITSCPDPECQKIVSKALKEEEVKRGVIREEQEQREVTRKQNMLQKKRVNLV